MPGAWPNGECWSETDGHWRPSAGGTVSCGLTAGGVVLISGAAAVRRQQEPLTVEEIGMLDPTDINGFDRSATAQWSTTARDVSNALVLPLMAAPLGLAIVTPGSRQSWTVAAMYAEVLLLGNGLGELLNGVANRTRPFVYNRDPNIPVEDRLEVDARLSFPSGHTTNAFAAAVFLSSVYARLHPRSSARTWIWAGSLTLAAATGYMRYQGRADAAPLKLAYLNVPTELGIVERLLVPLGLHHAPSSLPARIPHRSPCTARFLTSDCYWHV